MGSLVICFLKHESWFISSGDSPNPKNSSIKRFTPPETNSSPLKMDGKGRLYEPGSKLLVLGMVIQPLIGNPYNGYINPYYWVDDHPLLYIYYMEIMGV